MKTHYANGGFTGFGIFEKTVCRRYFVTDVRTSENSEKVTCKACKGFIKVCEEFIEKKARVKNEM